jgi:uncharacterized protein (DUF2147 family)
MIERRNALSFASCIGMFASLVASPAAAETLGIWQNPKNSVHIEIVSCDDARCGVVVWANEKAKADSLEGGTAELVGTTLLRNFREKNNGKWKGKAFVPDIDKEFSGTLTFVDASTIRVKGCLVWIIGCKSQTWTRISPER